VLRWLGGGSLPLRWFLNFDIKQRATYSPTALHVAAFYKGLLAYLLFFFSHNVSTAQITYCALEVFIRFVALRWHIVIDLLVDVFPCLGFFFFFVDNDGMGR